LFTGDSHDWGQNFPADQNLLYVRGFDPTTRRNGYDVNQRFGSRRPQDASGYQPSLVRAAELRAAAENSRADLKLS